MSHIPNSQLKIQIIAEYTQLRCVGTAANYKVLHNHITAQLLLSKHRHSKKSTSTKIQPVTSQGYLQSKDIDRILSIYPFQDLLAGVKFETIQILRVRRQRKGRKIREIRPSLARKGNEIRANLPKSNKSRANRHEAKLPV